MSTNIADMGLYQLNVVFDGGSRNVDQVMYWTQGKHYFIPDPDPNFPIVNDEKDCNSEIRSLSRSSVQTDSPV